jgi:hypothetical protein
MFRVLIAILMLISMGAALGGCIHNSISDKGGMAAHADTDHQHSSQDSSNHDSNGHCCHLHCHQHLSIAPWASVVLSRKLQVSIPHAYRFHYVGPSLALLTRPPLAA